MKPSARLSPLSRRRLERFRMHRRGHVSFWILLVLFAFSLCAELIANDRPLLLNYNGALHFPIAHTYSDRYFGGDFDTEADYRDPFIAGKIHESGGWMLWPLIPYDYATINYDLPSPAPSPPSAENWLGTDDQGRDVLARLIYGFRLSLAFALALTLGSSAVGILAGAVQGYFGGKTDLFFQRFIEIWSGLPELFMLIILASFVEPNVGWLLLILLLFSWIPLSGLVRAEFLRARNFDYVRAARALGVSEWRICLRHLLPNALTSAMTAIPFLLSGAVTVLTTLDFLGFGLPPGSPSLGELLLQGKNNPQAAWLTLTAFFTIAVMLTLIIFMSEAVRDAFDPRKTLAPAPKSL